MQPKFAGSPAELETNLGEHYADNVKTLTAAQLQEIGAHFVARPISTMIHGEHCAPHWPVTGLPLMCIAKLGRHPPLPCHPPLLRAPT